MCLSVYVEVQTSTLISTPCIKYEFLCVQNKMNRDADHDAQGKPRQAFPEFVRDSFLQQFGMASVAKGKLLELLHFAHLEFEKGPEKGSSVCIYMQIICKCTCAYMHSCMHMI